MSDVPYPSRTTNLDPSLLLSLTIAFFTSSAYLLRSSTTVNHVTPFATTSFFLYTNYLYIFLLFFRFFPQLPNRGYQASPQPLLSLPPPHPTTPPPPEILQQTTSDRTLTASESKPCPLTKDSDEGSDTTPEAPKKTTKMKLFKDIVVAEKKLRQ
ncbi:hypothetical protein Tco_1028467 [Tanacetum coccineum]|uniref:Uncharacterized protein n=1 Tax=Tanacetum coccineum TaxID=301880 RepID=A0ABQ5G0M8_9ASTR